MIILEFSCLLEIILLIGWFCLLGVGREECNIELRVFLGILKD